MPNKGKQFDTTITILEWLSRRQHAPFTTTEFAKALNINRAAGYTYMHRLVDKQWVKRLDDGRFTGIRFVSNIRLHRMES